MSTPDKSSSTKGVIYAPWERAFDRILTPFEQFIHRETTSGMLLMGTAILALILANSFMADAYHHLLHIPVAVGIGSWSLSMSLHHWVNDGLMALFFFVVGMELKREMLVGELADVRQAALPIIAAIGGMAVPAMIYLLLNQDGDAMLGWGIPMATDIAFAVGALVLLARRVPKALITFLVALAIAVLLWYALLQSGVHSTLAGVLGAFTVPARPRYDPRQFSTRMKVLLGQYDESLQKDANIMTNERLYSVVQTMGNGLQDVQTPMQRLEHGWHLPVAFIVIPIFALFNAGIPLQLGTLDTTLSHPVFLGVLLGLLLGKFIGITGACWIALKLGVGQLPSGTRFSQIAAVSVLGGIGFTMSIFIAELGFAGQEEYLLMAKTGVLAASLLAGLLGFAWLWRLGRHHE